MNFDKDFDKHLKTMERSAFGIIIFSLIMFTVSLVFVVWLGLKISNYFSERVENDGGVCLTTTENKKETKRCIK